MDLSQCGPMMLDALVSSPCHWKSDPARRNVAEKCMHRELQYSLLSFPSMGGIWQYGDAMASPRTPDRERVADSPDQNQE